MPQNICFSSSSILDTSGFGFDLGLICLNKDLLGLVFDKMSKNNYANFDISGDFQCLAGLAST